MSEKVGLIVPSTSKCRKWEEVGESYILLWSYIGDSFSGITCICKVREELWKIETRVEDEKTELAQGLRKGLEGLKDALEKKTEK